MVKTSLSGAKHILWDQLSTGVTKFREYLNLVDDEKILVRTFDQICNKLREELELRPVKNATSIISIMNGASKEDL